MKKILSLVIVGLFSIGLVSAQKVKVLKGDLAFLKGQSKLNVEYVYDGMKVGKKQTEEEYIKEKTTEANKKEAGKAILG